MSLSVLNLNVAALGRPQVVEELDYEAWLATVKDRFLTRFPAAAGLLDLEGEPLTYLLEEFSYGVLLDRARINDAAMTNLLPFSTGNNLDYLAAYYDVVRLEDETDDRLRNRTWLAIVGRSTGGTAERYRYVAMTASLLVRDCVVWCGSDGPAVHVAVISTDNGGVASPELLSLVSAALNDQSVRMINDTIIVTAAVTATVNIAANVWLLPGAAASTLADIDTGLRAAWDSEGGLGRDLVRPWIVGRAMISGVQRFELVSPVADRLVVPSERVALGTITLTLKGTDY